MSRLPLPLVALALAAASDADAQPLTDTPADTTPTDTATPDLDPGLPPDPPPEGLVLADLLARVDDHPLVHAARAELESYEAKLQQAYWAPFSNLNASVMFTVIPGADYALTDEPSEDPRWHTAAGNWGPWVRLEVSGAIPLFTFGKIWNLWEAAEAGVEAGEAGVHRARHRVRWEVRRAWFTLCAAREALYLIADGRGYIDDARSQIRARLDRGEPGASMIDMYKLDAAVAEVDARELQARRLEAVALEGLRLLAGLGDDEPVADLPLEPFDLDPEPVEHYRDLALRRRPELRQLDAALEAQAARRDIEFARFFPDLALGLYAGYAHSPVTRDQLNPFANDPYNTSGAGASLLLQIPLDFGLDNARLDEAEAGLRALQAQRDALDQAVRIEVEEAYAAVVEAEGRMQAYDRARLAGKRWVLAVLQGMSLGLHESQDLIDALVAYFTGELNYANAVYDHDLAWSRLALATGGDFLDELPPSD